MVESRSLLEVDWSRLPAPEDDGAASHLPGTGIADVALPSTAGGRVALARLPGRAVLFVYPMTGTPGVALPDGWDAIPGARGCTPHACAFRDLHAEFAAAGVGHVFGVSAQSPADQQEAAGRLHLPFPLLSDEDRAFADALALPMFEVQGRTLLKRLALVSDDGRISKVFYPVFPPDRNAADVLAWLKANPR